MLLVCSDIIKIVVNCLFLRVLNCLSTLRYQIKVGLDTKFSKFCLKLLKEIFTDRFVGMIWNCYMGYRILHIIWEKTFILLSAMEFVEFHRIRVCVWKAILEEKLLNPSQFLILLKMVRHMHKDDGDEDCHCSLPSNIQFWQFYNLILSHLENFCRLWYTVLLCC